MADDGTLIPLVADGTDQAALINHMLATSSDSVLRLPAGNFWIGSNIYVPAGKTLVGAGQGLTTLNLLPTFDPLVDNRAIVLGDGAGLSDFTLDGQKVGIGLGTAARICGVVGVGVDFLVERVSVVDVTGYAFWAYGNDHPERPPASGIFRDCYAENANVLFETSDADGVLFEGCVGADGDGDLSIAAAFHPASGSQNISFVDCEYYGVAAVVDVLANLGDQAGISFLRVHGTTTGPANAVYIVGAGRNQVTMVDSSFVALQGSALLMNNSDLLAVGTSFETPLIGVAIDANSTAHFSDSQIVVDGDPQLEIVAFGIYADGPVLWEGGAISVSGPAGSAAYNGGATLVGASVIVQGVEEAEQGSWNVVAGGAAPEILRGTEGDDILYTSGVSPSYARPYASGLFVAPLLDTAAFVDLLFGNGGNDRLFAGYGDNVDGGAGYDSLLISFQGGTGGVAADFRPAAGGGQVTIAGARITGVEAIEWLEGSNYDDLLMVGEATADYAPIFGLGGSDYILAGRRTGSTFGGDGNDTIDLVETQFVSAHFGEAGNDRITGGNVDDRIFGGDGNDRIEGNLGGDLLDGGDGSDILEGDAGNDTLDGGAGDDRLEGGSGSDLLLLQDGGEDRAYGGDDNDLIYFGTALSAGDVADGGAGRDAIVLQGNLTVVLSDTNLVGIESISIQSGANTQFGDVLDFFYDFNLTMADGNVAAGQQLIVNGSSLRDGEDLTFDGSAETDGKFLVYGGHGVDDLTGGDGVDVFFFEGQRWGPNDRVDGGAGRDALVISAGSGLTHIAFGADSLTDIESISLNNLFATDPSQSPSYDLVLHNGNVALGGSLIVNGSSIASGGQVVMIDGRGVHDGSLILLGGGGHDTLVGGDGGDTFLGGAGADGLAGGAGADIFRYDSASDSTVATPDTIGDFQVGVDKFDLGRIDADSHQAGDQAFHWIGASAFSGGGAASAGELRVFETNGLQRVEGDTNGDGVADLVIVIQIGAAPLTQGDFLF